MNVIFTLSKAADFFPLYAKKLPIELFRLENGILFDGTYGLFREYFPEADNTVVGEGGPSVVSEITDKCDLLNVPSGNMFTRMFVYASFSAAHNRKGLCLFHPGNAKVTDMDVFAPVLRKIANDPVASASLVVYSFNGPVTGGRQNDFVIEKGTKVTGDLCSVKAFRTAGDVAAWKEKNKYRDEKEVFCPGSGVLSFNPVSLIDSVAAGNEELRSLYHVLVSAWEDPGSAGTLLKDACAVLDGFDLLELMKNADDKLFVEVPAKLDRIGSFGDMLPTLELDGQGNYVSGNAELDRVFRSAVINQGEMKLLVSGLNDVLVLSNALGTSVRGIF